MVNEVILDISLFVPGLFDIKIDAGDDELTGLTALECLLARGHRTATMNGSYNAALCKLFRYTQGEDQDIPMAAIGRLIDDDNRPEGYWMRADPVHLLTHQKSLSLLDPGSFPLTQHDALALAASVQQSFADLGWKLEVPVPTRWYVKMDNKPSIRTSEIDEVIGQDIYKYMPTGDDAGIWHRLMNEIQMHLHGAEINQIRTQRGEVPINSLWLWGTGALPGLLERRWSRVYSDDNATMGLSMLSNTPCSPLPEMAEDIFTQQHDKAEVLVVMSAFQTTILQRQQGEARLKQFENNWCRFLLQQLREGRLRSLRIITRAWEFEISRIALMKFWKSAKTFNFYIAE